MLVCQKPRIYDVDIAGMVAVAGLSVVLWWFMIQPLHHRVVQQRQMQRSVHDEKLQAESELGQIQQQLKRQELLAARLCQSVGLLKLNTGMPDILKKIHHLAAKSKLRFDGLLPFSGQKSHDYRRSQLQVKMYGTAPQVLVFLQGLAEELPYVKVGDLSVISKQNDRAVECEVAITLDVFSLG